MYTSKDNTDTREIKRGEIYFIDLSNIDYMDTHISGKSRPGLIIQNDVGNENSNNVIIALMTSAEKKYYPFQYKIGVNGRINTIMFDQIMTVSKQNLESKMGELTSSQMREADIALMCSLNLTPYSIVSIKDFNIIKIITERTKNNETSIAVVEIDTIIGEKEIRRSGNINLLDISQYDPSITQMSDMDEIKTKLNNCAGLNFLMNHIQI